MRAAVIAVVVGLAVHTMQGMADHPIPHITLLLDRGFTGLPQAYVWMVMEMLHTNFTVSLQHRTQQHPYKG